MKLGLYRHYKGNNYAVFAIGKHTETLEKMVIYKRFNCDQYGVWVRPLDMFLEEIIIDNRLVKRFEFISEIKH